MRRTKAEAEQTRLLIMQKGLEQFALKGVAGTSSTDIAQLAGCTRGAIYWHFGNKWQLFEAICEHYSAPLKRLSDAGLADDEQDPLGKLRALLVRLLVEIERNEGFRRVMLVFIRESSGMSARETPAPVARFLREQHERRLAVLRNAIRRRQLPADIDHEVASWMIKAMVDGFVGSWFQHAGGFSLAQHAEAFVDSVLTSINTVRNGRACSEKCEAL